MVLDLFNPWHILRSDENMLLGKAPVRDVLSDPYRVVNPPIGKRANVNIPISTKTKKIQ